MARPKADTVVFRIALTLHREYDADLLKFFDEHPPESKGRQEALKALMRGGLPQGKNEAQGEFDAEALADALGSMIL